jgi:dolichyl-diphosphooligosaccharide--protein glycosyltransferase
MGRVHVHLKLHPALCGGPRCAGPLQQRLHVGYSIWAVFGTLLSVSVPFIGAKIIHKPEHFPLISVFVGLQVWGLFGFLRASLSPSLSSTAVVASLMSLPVLMFRVPTGLLGGFSGLPLQMFDPSYATKNIPIIAFIAEHQPSSCAVYFMDCRYLIIAFPVGCDFIIRLGLTEEGEGHFLLLIWGMSTLYFASIIVRLVLVFTPVLAFVAAFRSPERQCRDFPDTASSSWTACGCSASSPVTTPSSSAA